MRSHRSLLLPIAGAALLTVLAAALACAQEVEGLKGMTRPENALGMPSFGRLLGVLLLMIAIAVAVLFAIRKWQPRLQSHFSAARCVKVVERAVVGTAQVYLLQVDDSRVLLSQCRGRVSMLLLSKSSNATGSESKE